MGAFFYALLSVADLNVLATATRRYTQTIVVTASSQLSSRGGGESSAWKLLKCTLVLVNFTINIVMPLVELQISEPDTLLTPHFGQPGPLNFLGWGSSQLRGIRLLSNAVWLDVYVILCNFHLWNLRRAFSFQVKSSGGGAASALKILLKLTRQQMHLTIFTIIGSAFLLSGVAALFKTSHLLVVPCSLFAGFFSFPVLFMVAVNLICMRLLAPKNTATERKKKRSQVSAKSTVVSRPCRCWRPRPTVDAWLRNIASAQSGYAFASLAHADSTARASRTGVLCGRLSEKHRGIHSDFLGSELNSNEELRGYEHRRLIHD